MKVLSRAKPFILKSLFTNIWQYSCIKYDITLSVFKNNVFFISLHNNELHTDTIELKDSLFYKADDISDIINLEIGWGVIATCVFDIKNIEYNFDSYILPKLK